MNFSGVPTPPASEAGSRCHSADFSSLADFDVNNDFPSQTLFPQSPSTPPTRSRRDLQKDREAKRSQRFTTRLRSTTNSSEDSDVSLGREGSLGRRRKYQRQSLPSKQNHTDEALKAVEPLHEPVLTKMAFAEQQKWITVQQKTFTKWCVDPGSSVCSEARRLIDSRRLNTKIEPRELVVKDLVQDLSDGVSL